MKIVTVRAIVDPDGRVRWSVRTGVRMEEVELDVWMPHSSLLSWRLDPKYLGLLDSRDVVTDGDLHDIKVGSSQYGRRDEYETWMQKPSKPSASAGKIYVALEIYSPGGEVESIRSFRSRFMEAQLSAEGPNRLSQLWQVEFNGEISVTLNGVDWLICCHREGFVDVRTRVEDVVVAIEGPHADLLVGQFSLLDELSSLLESGEESDLLELQRHLVQLLYATNDCLAKMTGSSLSRYFSPIAIAGTTRVPPDRDFKKLSRSSRRSG